MTSKVRVRLINGERWYAALDLGGAAVRMPYGSGLDTAPYKWITKHVPSHQRKVIKLHTCHKGLTFLHEDVCERWLEYVSNRERTSDIRKAQSVACKAREAGIAWKEAA